MIVFNCFCHSFNNILKTIFIIQQLEDECGSLSFLMNAVPDISSKKLKSHFLPH